MSNQNPLNLIEGDRVVGPVVQLRRSRRLVSRDVLGMFKRPAVQQKCRDPRRSKRVAADPIGNSGRPSPALDHREHLAAVNASIGQFPLPVHRSEQWRAALF